MQDGLGSVTGPAFTSEPRDANGLQNHRARYYAPGLAVWTALDPWEGLHERPMSLNGYSWVEGRVVNATDASGEMAGLAAVLNSGLCAEQGRDGCVYACLPMWAFFASCMLQCQQSLLTPTIIPTVAIPVPTLTLPPIPFATNTPLPTPALPTLQPGQEILPGLPTSAPVEVWRSPMDNAALTNDGCMSRRVVSTFVPCSRDLNPRGLPPVAGYTVYAPNPHGVVWYSGEGVSGLGDVVILRYSVVNLPQTIQSQLPPVPAGGASMFIQYAHLNSRSVSSGEAIPQALQLGTSGGSGGSYIPHLDLTVIWIPTQVVVDRLGRRNFETAADSAQWDVLTTNQELYQARWTLDPLNLWPEIFYSETSRDVPSHICQPSACKVYSP